MRATAHARWMSALLAGVLASFAMIVGLAVPAQAHHNTITATVACGEAQNTWVVAWSLNNSESDKSEEVIASSNPMLVPVGTTIGPGKTLTVDQGVTAPQDLLLEVSAEWDSGAQNTNQGFVSQKDFPLDCWDGGGTYDECAELPGDQPKGFPCTKDPSIRKVERSQDGCDLGGVRTWTDVYTTTYTFTDGEWVANPESGPVRENEIFTPYTAEELREKGCTTEVVAIPSIVVVDGCGAADDSVTLSTSKHYTGVDNGDGTATFTTKAGYVFDTAQGEVTQVTLTYVPPSSAPCLVTAAKADRTPPACKVDGTLVIPQQPEGVRVTPAPGTYGPGIYHVNYAAERGYELTKDPSRRYKIGKAVNNLCADPPGDGGPGGDPSDTPEVPNTGGDDNPEGANPTASPALPNTGASAGLSAEFGAGALALIAGMGMIVMARIPRSQR